MTDRSESGEITRDPEPANAVRRRARDEIGELAVCLDEVKRNLLEVDAHFSRPPSTSGGTRGHAQTMAVTAMRDTQDPTSRKVHQAFQVLEEVAARLGKIHALLSLRGESASAPDEAPGAQPAPAANGSVGGLVDETVP